MMFSIIVPIFNQAKYLEKCIQSILEQKENDYELILVDDGSNDGSEKLCDEYGKKYANRVKVIHQENQGLASARNNGMACASGDWILFVDSDDYVDSSWLRCISKKIISEDVDLVCWNSIKVYADHSERLIFKPEDETLVFFNEERIFSYYKNSFLKYKVGWEVWARAFKRDIIEKHQIKFQECKEVFAEDLLFTFQYQMCCTKIAFLCRPLYYYRQVSNSIVHTIDEEALITKIAEMAVRGFYFVKQNKAKYISKNYYWFYFLLLNHHIQFKVPHVSDERLKQVLNSLNNKKEHKKWMKEIRKKIDRRDMDVYMENRVWL